MVKLMYTDSMCAVLCEGETTEWFHVKTGVKQGCVMSGFLFLIVIDWVMTKTTLNQNMGIRWRFTTKLDDLDFADDIALLSSTHTHMQQKTTNLSNFAKCVGLKINERKTKILRVNSRKPDAMKLEENDIEDVDEFVYLGATVSNEKGAGRDINSRINKARTAFARLNKIWRSRQYSRQIKIKLYKSIVRPVLLYGCETWKMTRQG